MIDLNAKLDEAIKIARYAVSLHDVQVIKQYTPKALVMGNPEELLHVFINLIINAVQAMESGGILTVSSTRQPNALHVRVSDTGCGMPQKQLEQIFEPFFTTKPPGKGTGLGLYNTKHVITKMHGSISVESQPGMGSTFTISFPPAQTD